MRSPKRHKFRDTIRTSPKLLLSSQLEQCVHERVASGTYQAASQIISKGLGLLKPQRRDRQAAFATLNSELKRGSEQAE
jgi:putative addiction module CopG family antidote